MTRRRVAQHEAVVREILECIDAGGTVSQRRLARELGIALGLTNAHLKRCVAEGLVEVAGRQGRRYRYELTATGSRERDRLGARQAARSVDLVGRLCDSFDRLYAGLVGNGVARIVLCGVDPLTDIAVLCCLGSGLRPIGVWRHAGRPAAVRGVPSITLANIVNADAVVLSVMRNAENVYSALRHRLPPERIAVPDVLDLELPAAAGRS